MLPHEPLFSLFLALLYYNTAVGIVYIFSAITTAAAVSPSLSIVVAHLLMFPYRRTFARAPPPDHFVFLFFSSSVHSRATFLDGDTLEGGEVFGVFSLDAHFVEFVCVCCVRCKQLQTYERERERANGSGAEGEVVAAEKREDYT